jgi:hypothetical protein
MAAERAVCEYLTLNIGDGEARRRGRFKTAIVVNTLPTLATFTITSGPMVSFGGPAAVRAKPEETAFEVPMSTT